MNLSKNKLKRINIKLGEGGCLPNLRHLDLSHNKIAHIPPVFYKNFKELTHFDLSYNRMTDISPQFLDLTKLEFLGLTGNLIQRLPCFLKELSLSAFQFEWPYYIKYTEDKNHKRKYPTKKKKILPDEETTSVLQAGGAFSTLRKDTPREIDKYSSIEIEVLRKCCRVVEARGQAFVTFYDYFEVATKKECKSNLRECFNYCLVAIRK